MKIVNIHEAKTHLSRLVEGVVEGESFIIAKSGRPLVKVVPFVAAGADQPKRLGFLAGQIAVPADFNTMASQPREDKTGDEG